MNQIYDLISPPDSAMPVNTGPVGTGPVSTGPVGACGSAIRDHSAADTPMLAAFADASLAAKAAAKEASRVSAMLAAGMLSLTNLTPDALPELLQRP
jgi:hypothetical protein